MLATNKKNIIASNSLVLVNTAIDSNAIVLLSNTSFGSIVTVRDLTGNARSNIPIYISTVTSVQFVNSLDSNFLIQQPFGSLSFAAAGSNKWSVLNTFAFNTPTPTAVSTPVVNISSILFKDIGTGGRASLLNISSFLQLDGSNVVGGGGGDEEPIVIPDPLVQQSIFASTITVFGSNIPNTTKSYSFYVTGVKDPLYPLFTNIRTSQDGLNWSNFSVEFTNGFGTDIKANNNYIVFAGFANIGATTDLQIHFITGNSVETRNIYQADFGVSPNAFLKYEQGSDGYHSILFNDSPNETTKLLYTSNIATTSEWSVNNSMTNLSGAAVSFITGYSNIYIVCSTDTAYTFSNIVDTYIQSTTFTQGNGFDDSLSISKIIYSPVDSVYLINGRSYSQQRTYWSSDGKLWGTGNDALPVGVIPQFFKTKDMYINQGTPVEEGLPRIIYVGTNDIPGGPLIYYSYEQNITQQSNFKNIIPTPEQITSVNSINLQSQFANNAIWIGTGNTGSGSSRITVDNFLQSNISVKAINGLSETYSLLPPYVGVSLDPNTRIETSGTLKTSFVTFSNSDQPKKQTLSASNRTLYRNTYPINPVGGFIEFVYNVSINSGGPNIVSYPLSIGTLGAFSNGWWQKVYSQTGQSFFNPQSVFDPPSVYGFTILPGYSLLVRGSNNLTGNTLYSNTNVTLQPIYSNVFNLSNTYLSGSYRLSAVI